MGRMKHRRARGHCQLPTTAMQTPSQLNNSQGLSCNTNLRPMRLCCWGPSTSRRNRRFFQKMAMVAMVASRTHTFQICSATFACNPAAKNRHPAAKKIRKKLPPGRKYPQPAANAKTVSNKCFTLDRPSSFCSKRTVCSCRILAFVMILFCNKFPYQMIL